MAILDYTNVYNQAATAALPPSSSLAAETPIIPNTTTTLSSGAGTSSEPDILAKLHSVQIALYE